MDLKSNKEAVIIVVIILLAVYWFYSDAKKTAGKVLGNIGIGDSEGSRIQKETDSAQLKKQIESKFWLNKEKTLPQKQRTQITNATARSLAVALWENLRPENIRTMTNANNIYDILSRIGTEGGLYFVIHHYGVRDGMDLPTSLRYNLGFSNKFSKDLDEVNILYRKRGFNYKF